MGGIGLADMLISLYRTTVRTKRWYLKVLFHCVDTSKVKVWLLYCCHCNQLNISKKKQLSLLTFICKIAEGLGTANKVPRGTGKPRKSMHDVPAAKHKSSQPLPSHDARYDGMHHWPEYGSNKLSCSLCKVGNSRIYCKKCNIILCMSNIRNWFLQFHTK